jgi:hypothetical protein
MPVLAKFLVATKIVLNITNIHRKTYLTLNYLFVQLKVYVSNNKYLILLLSNRCISIVE